MRSGVDPIYIAEDLCQFYKIKLMCIILRIVHDSLVINALYFILNETKKISNNCKYVHDKILFGDIIIFKLNTFSGIHFN